MKFLPKEPQREHNKCFASGWVPWFIDVSVSSPNAKHSDVNKYPLCGAYLLSECVYISDSLKLSNFDNFILSQNTNKH